MQIFILLCLNMHLPCTNLVQLKEVHIAALSIITKCSKMFLCSKYCQMRWIRRKDINSKYFLACRPALKFLFYFDYWITTTSPSSESLFIRWITQNDFIFDFDRSVRSSYKSKVTMQWKVLQASLEILHVTSWQLWKFQIHTWNLIVLYNIYGTTK